ncbi:MULTISPECIES: fimbrial protein [unclassified Pseudomonas]|jgi:major type 1 subunit fimbrin (pilin)|uniref:fimbrial protein n=1 Tax=unclassified Pseudomonas TaxID=196821 RepID=UPI000C2FA568|nr:MULTISPECIES: fimbrial protein [unclassified Pseudomonas]MCU1740417.1 type 1 fimbrial protein [Pseudomonas sp. 20S_6.2_Bac1]
MKAPLFVLPLLAAAMITNTTQAATTGSLRFTGNIEGGTCRLDAGDVSRTIELPLVKVSDFDNSTWAGLKTFNLTADCDADIRNVTFTFDGTPDTWLPAHFANIGGTARGVATAIESRIGGTASNIPANGNPAARGRTIPTSAGKAVLPMGAYYKKTVIGSVGKGTTITTASVTITYN